MKLLIDEREVVCREGQTVLEAARGAGIAIPSLCDHRDLVPFAGCRVCLVEVDGRRDPVPSCATPAEDGQVVRTRTPEVLALRRKVLELILASHPYACLVCAEKPSCEDLKSTIRKVGEVTGCVLCPANGDCELQRVVEEVGLDRIDVPAVYRGREVRRDDPFFDRDDNLCILCGRCVRICEEVRGAAVLSFVHRGDRTLVGTPFDRSLLDSGCRFCGACVDACPTAALVERAARALPRPTGAATVVCPFCGQGCRLELRTRDGEVLAARPAEGPPNGGQGCVKGRFLVRGALSGPGRIREAHVREDGRLAPVPFEEAVDRAARGLSAAAPEKRALLYPSQAALEDAFAYLEFGRRTLSTEAVEASPAAAIWQRLDALEAERGLRIPATGRLSSIGAAKAVLAWRLNLPDDHPLAWLEVVRAVRAGARLFAAGRVPAGPVGAAATVLDPEAGPDRIARALPADGPTIILFDAAAAAGPRGLDALEDLWTIAGRTGARLFPLGRTANGRGVHELERALGRPPYGTDGSSVRARLAAGAFDALVLAAPAPDLGRGGPGFLVCVDTHWTPQAEKADVVLPAAAFAEAGGTWVSTEGRVRTYGPAVPAPGSARPDRDVLAALADRMGLPGRMPRDCDALLAEIRRRVPALEGYDPAASGDEFFLREVRPNKPPRTPAGARPAPDAGRADVLRGYDPLTASRSYAKMRRAR